MAAAAGVVAEEDGGALGGTESAREEHVAEAEPAGEGRTHSSHRERKVNDGVFFFFFLAVFAVLGLYPSPRPLPHTGVNFF